MEVTLWPSYAHMEMCTHTHTHTNTHEHMYAQAYACAHKHIHTPSVLTIHTYTHSYLKCYNLKIYTLLIQVFITGNYKIAQPDKDDCG